MHRKPYSLSKQLVIATALGLGVSSNAAQTTGKDGFSARLARFLRADGGK